MKGTIRLDKWGRVELYLDEPVFDNGFFEYIGAVTYEDTEQAIEELGSEPVRTLVIGEADEVRVEFDPKVVLHMEG